MSAGEGRVAVISGAGAASLTHPNGRVLADPCRAWCRTRGQPGRPVPGPAGLGCQGATQQGVSLHLGGQALTRGAQVFDRRPQPQTIPGRDDSQAYLLLLGPRGVRPCLAASVDFSALVAPTKGHAGTHCCSGACPMPVGCPRLRACSQRPASTTTPAGWRVTKRWTRSPSALRDCCCAPPHQSWQARGWGAC